MAIKISRGKRNTPRRTLLYGVPGVGKSTWAAQANNPIFLPTEDGIDDLDVPHFDKPGTAGAAMACVAALAEQEDLQDFKGGTLVVDSADWLEKLIHNEVLSSDGADVMSEALGGYGKGYEASESRFRNFLDSFDWLRHNMGMDIILIAHAKTAKHTDPDHPPYDKFVPKLHQRVTDALVEWCDEVFFANYKTYTTTTEGGFGKSITKAVGDGERVMRCTAKATAVASNRLGMPDEVPFSYDVYNQYRTKGK